VAGHVRPQDTKMRALPLSVERPRPVVPNYTTKMVIVKRFLPMGVDKNAGDSPKKL
jgi:hypothetical protein